MTHRVMVIGGASGFVGRHLVAALRDVYGADAVIPTSQNPQPGVVALDVTDDATVRAALEAERPTHVVNLAGIAAPGQASEAGLRTWDIHVHAAERLGRRIVDLLPGTWLLHIGSGLAYGRTARHGQPVKETEAFEPMDTYGVTKAAGDMAVGAVPGLRVARMRPFNHTGAGQTTSFVVPAFAEQVARIEAGLQERVLRVGNLTPLRDFLHVDDVVAAYMAVIATSDTLQPGCAFNVASGASVAMQDVLERLLAMSSVSIEVQTDPTRQRPSDLHTISGDCTELTRQTGWRPTSDLDAAIAAVLEDQRATLRRA